jgi:hypothetical protein
MLLPRAKKRTWVRFPHLSWFSLKCGACEDPQRGESRPRLLRILNIRSGMPDYSVNNGRDNMIIK